MYTLTVRYRNRRGNEIAGEHSTGDLVYLFGIGATPTCFFLRRISRVANSCIGHGIFAKRVFGYNKQLLERIVARVARARYFVIQPVVEIFPPPAVAVFATNHGGIANCGYFQRKGPSAAYTDILLKRGEKALLP